MQIPKKKLVGGSGVRGRQFKTVKGDPLLFCMSKPQKENWSEVVT